MKCLFAFLFLLATGLCGHSQALSPTYKLTLSFGPAFIYSSQLTIELKGSQAYLQMNIGEPAQHQVKTSTYKAVIAAATLDSLIHFLQSYNFRIKGSVDTIGSHKELVNGDSIILYQVRAGLDGIIVKGTLEQNFISHQFGFWSPDKGTENARLMQLTFNLLNQVYTDPAVVNYLEQLQQYFPHGLGLRKLSNQPLTYKLYGSISSDEAEELETFLRGLPRNRKVYIDMSNYSGMGTMFYDDFEDYCKGKKNIFFLHPSYRGLVDLYKIGIPQSQIISKKRIVRITNENNKETIITNED